MLNKMLPKLNGENNNIMNYIGPSWDKRRRRVNLIIIFFAVIFGYLAFNTTSEAVILGLIEWSAIGIVVTGLGYVGAVVYEDVKCKNGNGNGNGNVNGNGNGNEEHNDKNDKYNKKLIKSEINKKNKELDLYFLKIDELNSNVSSIANKINDFEKQFDGFVSKYEKEKENLNDNILDNDNNKVVKEEWEFVNKEESEVFPSVPGDISDLDFKLDDDDEEEDNIGNLKAEDKQADNLGNKKEKIRVVKKNNIQDKNNVKKKRGRPSKKSKDQIPPDKVYPV